MALLLTQTDLRQLTNSSTFYRDVLTLLEQTLLQPDEEAHGHATFLKFPLGIPDRAVQIYPLASPASGCFVRISPVTEGQRPATDGDFVAHLDRATGQLRALIATDELSPLRTAAPVGLACRHLAPVDARRLAVLGSGLQARFQLRCISEALPSLEDVRVFSPTALHREALAQEMAAQVHLPITPVASAAAAVENADIVCVTAGGRSPALQLSWVRPGVLVTLINSAAALLTGGERRIAPARHGPVVRPSGYEPHPPFSMAANGGCDLSQFAAFLTDVLAGTAVAREHPNQTVVYEQLGAAVWDAPLLSWVYTWAVERGVGTPFHLTATAG
jgi:ornithine cyclodeaminase/alanine dehydrogenase-like protein (mu-crystallin family)